MLLPLAVATSAHADPAPTLAETTGFLVKRMPEFSRVAIVEDRDDRLCVSHFRMDIDIRNARADGCQLSFVVHMESKGWFTDSPGGRGCHLENVYTYPPVDIAAQVDLGGVQASVNTPGSSVLDGYEGKRDFEDGRRRVEPAEIGVMLASPGSHVVLNGAAAPGAFLFFADPSFAPRAASAFKRAAELCPKPKEPF
jgi:hypothetical protein